MKTFEDFLAKDEVLTEDAQSILNSIISSQQFDALTKSIEDKVDANAHDGDDYRMLINSIIPKLSNALKNKLGV